MSPHPASGPRRSLRLGQPDVLALAGWVLAWVGVTGLWGWRLWQEERLFFTLRQQGGVCDLNSWVVPIPEWLALDGALVHWGPHVVVTDNVSWCPNPITPDRTAPAWNQLRGLISLERLFWHQSPTDDDWRHLEAFTSLRVLKLQSATLPPGALARIARLPRLQCLILENCQWPKGELADLATARQLELLAFDFSPVDSGELMSLTGLRRLRSLSLTGCGVSEATTREFLQHKPWIDLSDD
jgi:hypothetical protein